MNLRCSTLGVTCCAILIAGAVDAGDAISPMPLQLVVHPPQVTLIGPRSEQRVIVTGVMDDGSVQDVTAHTHVTGGDERVARTENFMIRPVADGATNVTATLGSLSVTISVEVRHTAQPAPVSFQAEVLAALTKAG
jgi:hypothetical protein